MLVIGLTGGIGSGKSSVAKIFSDSGIEVIDADQLARQVVEPGEPALEEISKHFGNEFLLADGSLNRSKLRSEIFAHPESKSWLEHLLHPLIQSEAQKQIAKASSPYCIYMAPLLIENNLHNQVSRVLIVDVTPELQLSRTMKRDNKNVQEIKNIMQSQVSRKQRHECADDVIDNNGEPDKLIPQVHKLHQKYLELAK